uniref:Secreted protein n=1 Tax=Nelumbo nucifera TaxID=4432 RepID=A0A822YC01_NELNU|nr:TPA_asm: hypothetical protein HUJ06_028516 [Nelumbo nucifera]
MVLWGYLFLSFCISDDNASVKVTARVLQIGEIIEMVGDLLIAADGCLSKIRQSFLPYLKLRLRCMEGCSRFLGRREFRHPCWHSQGLSDMDTTPGNTLRRNYRQQRAQQRA